MCKACDRTDGLDMCERCAREVSLELAAQEARTAVDTLVERALEALRETASATLVACLMPLVPLVWVWSAAAAIWGVLWE